MPGCILVRARGQELTEAFQFAAVKLGLGVQCDPKKSLLRGGAIGSTWAFGA